MTLLDNWGRIRTAETGGWEKTTKEEQKENKAVYYWIRPKPGAESQSDHKSWCPFFTLMSPHTARSCEPFLHLSPKYWTKETDRIKSALNKRNLQQIEMEARERKGGWWGGRGPKESTWWSLYFTSMFVIIVLFFNISYVCIFLPTEERVNKLKEKAKWCMNVKGTERKVLTECLSPFFLLLLKERQFTILQWVKAAQLVVVSCWENNDCVIKMADRYCYQSLFKELFIHIITTFIIPVLQMLSTLLSIWGIIVLQYAVHKIDRKDFFICKREVCPV